MSNNKEFTPDSQYDEIIEQNTLLTDVADQVGRIKRGSLQMQQKIDDNNMLLDDISQLTYDTNKKTKSNIRRLDTLKKILRCQCCTDTMCKIVLPILIVLIVIIIIFVIVLVLTK